MRRLLLALAAVLSCLGAFAAPAPADGVMSSNPFWFRDDYLSLAWTDVGATTARVDTRSPGVVTLPYNPIPLAFDLADGERLVLIGSSTGALAWAWDGEKMARAPAWDLSLGEAPVALAWIDEGRVAAAVSDAVRVFGWTGDGWRELSRVSLPGVSGVAAGVPGHLVAVTGGRIFVYAWDGTAYRLTSTVPSESGLRGVASEPGGGRLAVWTDALVRVYGWDGGTYRRALTWEVPDSSVPTPVLGVAFIPDGYWIWSPGEVSAYGFAGSYVVAWPALGLSAAPEALSLARAWEPRSFALLGPSGYRLWEWSGAGMREVAAEEVSGLSLGVYLDSALYQSQVLVTDHDLSELQVSAAVPSLPDGTTLVWSISTDGGQTWLDVPICMNAPSPADCGAYNVPVPPGRSLVYRIALSTADPRLSPVVDATEIAEIVTTQVSDQKVEASLVK